MFDTAFDAWTEAEQEANDAWAAVCARSRSAPPFAGCGLDLEITRALRLRRRALQLLQQVHQELRACREQLTVL